MLTSLSPLRCAHLPVTAAMLPAASTGTLPYSFQYILADTKKSSQFLLFWNKWHYFRDFVKFIILLRKMRHRQRNMVDTREICRPQRLLSRQLWLPMSRRCSPGQGKTQLLKYRSSWMMAVQMGVRKCGAVRKSEVPVGRVWERECTPGQVTLPP